MLLGSLLHWFCCSPSYVPVGLQLPPASCLTLQFQELNDANKRSLFDIISKIVTPRTECCILCCYFVTCYITAITDFFCRSTLANAFLNCLHVHHDQKVEWLVAEQVWNLVWANINHAQKGGAIYVSMMLFFSLPIMISVGKKLLRLEMFVGHVPVTWSNPCSNMTEILCQIGTIKRICIWNQPCFGNFVKTMSKDKYSPRSSSSNFLILKGTFTDTYFSPTNPALLISAKLGSSFFFKPIVLLLFLLTAEPQHLHMKEY